jgi:hypothetical protein
MADISNFVSALTQGNEDAVVIGNAAQVGNDTPSTYGVSGGALPADWDRIWRFTDNASNGWLVFPFVAGNHTWPTTNHKIVGFYIYLEDVTPSAETPLFGCSNSTGRDFANWVASEFNFTLILETDGDIRLVDDSNGTVATATTPLSADTWHRVEIRTLIHATTGEVQVWVDGTDIFGGNQTSITMVTDTEAWWFVGGLNAEIGDVYTFFAGGYCMINSTAASDRLDSDFEVVGPYQSTDFSGRTPDNGDALDDSGAGADWANVNDIPFSDETRDTDAVEYEGSGALAGSIDYDNGPTNTRAGPNGDSRVDSDAAIKGWKGIWRLERGNGSGTTHTAYIGDDAATWSSGFDSVDVALGATPANFYFVTDDSTNMPTSSQHFTVGFGKGAGGREIYCHEMAAFVLHVPAAEAGVPELTMATRIPT